MNLSKFTDYALRACLYLGAHQGRIVPISEIAQAYGLSQSNLMKVVNQLVDGGFLNSRRGRSGGVELAQSAAKLKIGDIARFMEGDGAMVDCTTCLLRGNCGLVSGLVAAKNAFYQSLNETSVADAVLAQPGTLPLLQSAYAPSQDEISVK